MAGGVKAQAAALLDMPISTFKDLIRRAGQAGVLPDALTEEAGAVTRMKMEYETKISDLKADLKKAQQDTIKAEQIRRFYFDLADNPALPPKWLHDPEIKRNQPVQGIPTLHLSDLHWGETVDPAQVNGLNEFNLEVAKRRLKRTLDNAIDLCFNHLQAEEYPGLVLLLGGDMFAGEIHDELSATNEADTMVLLFDLFDHLVAGINLLQAHFGRIFIACTYGNHGRTTKKPQFKDAAFSNMDWALYNMLERHFKANKNKNVTFYIPSGFDALYKVYNTTYLLTHGDRLGTGGTGGMLGTAGTVMRGAQKIRNQYALMGVTIDEVECGHFHTYMALPGIRVNGTLKGFDEYALGLRFTPAPPVQALWITHHQHGITHQVPVFCEGVDRLEAPDVWASIPFGAK